MDLIDWASCCYLGSWAKLLTTHILHTVILLAILKLIIIVPWNLAGRDLGHADLIGARSELRLFSASELLPQERPESSPLY
jgi:hypothetical protein